jgi:RNA polymerase sigma factor (sigma-70 family)
MVQWEAELTELVMRRSGALVGYAYSLTRDKPQAEDLVQDALVKVYSRLRRPPEMSDGGRQVVELDQPKLTNVEAYVRRAILTIFLDGYRRQSNFSGLKHLLADDPHSPGAERVATARVDVGVALAKLSPRQREVVVLRFFEDMTVPQIAAALGTRPGTIKRHLSNATEVLRGSLAEVPAPDVDTNLDQRLGALAGAVRRRRAVKVGAVAGVSMVLAGLLAMAAMWGPARLLSDPVPPATPSPNAEAVGGGWQPTGWHEHGPQFHCGMDVTALTSTSDVVRMEITGDVEVVKGTGPAATGGLEAPIRTTRTGGEGQPIGGGLPRVVFAQDGQVVDIGWGWHEGGHGLLRAGESAADDVAGAMAATACGEWTMNFGPLEEYRDERPAGTYDVYAVAWWSNADGARGVVVSDPVTMEVPAIEMPDEEPLAIDIRDGYQPPWLEGTDLACGGYASAIPGIAQTPQERFGLEVVTGGSDKTMKIELKETQGAAFDTTLTPFTLVWLSAGRVVGVGSDVWSEPVERLQVDANGETTVAGPVVEPDRTCLENPDAGMPEGSYDLYALTELDPGSGGERQFLTVGVSQGYSYIVGD